MALAPRAAIDALLDDPLDELAEVATKGGWGSGHHAHEGRLGGGSLPRGGAQLFARALALFRLRSKPRPAPAAPAPEVEGDADAGAEVEGAGEVHASAPSEAAKWDEEDHPRDDDGRFTSGGGAGDVGESSTGARGGVGHPNASPEPRGEKAINALAAQLAGRLLALPGKGNADALIAELTSGQAPLTDKNRQQLLDRAEKRVTEMIDLTGGKIRDVKRIDEFMREGKTEGALAWYKAHEELREIFGADTEMFGKFLAATSENALVASNLTLGLKAYAQWKTGQPFKSDDPKHPGYLSAVIDNLNNAVAGREFEGSKVRNFARALAGDEDAVVIDRWMMRAYGFTKDSPTELQYATIEQVLRAGAASAKMSPASYQAAIWTSISTRESKRQSERGGFDEVLAGRVERGTLIDPKSSSWKVLNQAQRGVIDGLLAKGRMRVAAAEFDPDVVLLGALTILLDAHEFEAWRETMQTHLGGGDYSEALFAQSMQMAKALGNLLEDVPGYSGQHTFKLAELMLVMREGFDEEKHPRHPAGSPEGGKFAPAGGGGEGQQSSADSSGSGFSSAPQGKLGFVKQIAEGSAGTVNDVTVPASRPVATTNQFADADGDGVTDAALVGVPGNSVPPPPPVPRVADLTIDERYVEERFAQAYESSPDGMAGAYLAQVLGSKTPNTFSTDDAKMLSPDYAASNVNKALYNVPVHQTANAIAKRAFEHYVRETVAKLPEDQRSILVTAGGVAAGKGYALGAIDEAKSVAAGVGAVWDTAGEQNSTELPWIQSLAESVGARPIYAFIDANPKETFSRVVSRAEKTGRMVDLSLFAASYAIGSRNFQAFHEHTKERADFLFIENRGTPRLLKEFPTAALHNIGEIKAAAIDYLDQRNSSSATPLAPHILRGATIGRRVFQGRERGA